MASSSYQPSNMNSSSPHSTYSINPPLSRSTAHLGSSGGGGGYSTSTSPLNFYGPPPSSARNSNASIGGGQLFPQGNSSAGPWMQSRGSPTNPSDSVPATLNSSDASIETTSTTHSSVGELPLYPYSPQNPGNPFDPFTSFPDGSRRI
jgi:hypothetical protein